MTFEFSQGYSPDVPLDGERNDYLSGEIDFAVLRIEKGGSQNLTIRGWILNPGDLVVNLQIGIPGCRLSFARWIERFDLQQHNVENFYKYGFQATLSKNDLSAQLDTLTFIATLESGLSKVGIFNLPEVRIQKVPRYTEESRIPIKDSSKSENCEPVSSQPDQVDLSRRVQNNEVESKTTAKNDLDENFRANHLNHWNDRLKSFLNSTITYELPKVDSPNVTIIIPVHNKAELTFACLLSIMSSNYTSYEVVVINNDSNDKTLELLKRFSGIKVITSEENLHYLRGINFGVRFALGNNLLFLNNDTVLDPSAIERAVESLASNQDIGAVGGRIISFNGKLQEAGSMLLEDGGSYAYGVGDDPWDYKYLFEREVDYCSGAFLLTRKETFLENGGFDERYAPAYYEEVDYCIRLQEQGKKILYQPEAIVFHLEHGSADKSEVVKLQTKNRQTLMSLRSDFIKKAPNVINSVLRLGRGISDKRKKILFIDDRIPFQEAGAGFPRTEKILESLIAANIDLTFFPVKSSPATYNEISKLIPSTVELVLTGGEEGLESLIKQRFNFYDVIMISRPHNLEIWNRIKKRLRIENLRSKLVYDAESIFSEREIAKLDQTKTLILSDQEKDFIIAKELELATGFDHITVVCENDLIKMAEHGIESSGILSYSVAPECMGRSFDDRNDLLFVGPLLQENCPNVDGLNWFIEEVFPLVKLKLGKVIGLTVVGVKNSHLLCHASGVSFLGAVSTVKPFYDAHKLAIAPMRIAAGISIKTIEAGAYGTPVLTTKKIASLMNWENDSCMFYSDDPEELASLIVDTYRSQESWEKMRIWQMEKVAEEFSTEKFKKEISTLLDVILKVPIL